MKRIVKIENPLFSLYSATWNDCGDNEEANLEIFASDLKSAEIGDIFEAEPGAWYRYRDHETLKVVFKDEHGVAGLFRKEKYRTEVETDPEDQDANCVVVYDLESDVKLVWFELH
ncbi:hypothetical protein IJ103_01085 [Candidatus Saccharibacteria bacterium]|nr:hypothetical protein [Candidatus Saccharibacteria bacterium]